MEHLGEAGTDGGRGMAPNCHKTCQLLPWLACVADVRDKKKVKRTLPHAAHLGLQN